MYKKIASNSNHLELYNATLVGRWDLPLLRLGDKTNNKNQIAAAKIYVQNSLSGFLKPKIT